MARERRCIGGASRHAGFTEGEPWLPVDPGFAECNVDAQLAEEGSLLNWYRQLLRLRAKSPALHAGAYVALEDTPTGVFAYRRELDGRGVLVALNLTARDCELAVPPPHSARDDAPADASPEETWRVLLSTHRAPGEIPTLDQDRRIRLAPYEALLLEPSGT